MLSTALKLALTDAIKQNGKIIALTGAGISAESGIPTFRGEEGYWTVGSTEYYPEEMATNAAFRRMPAEVWTWYLYRRGICRQAKPNAGHRALVALEEALEDRFRLITQNVDGLHLQAGNSLERTYQIHGNIDYMRCAQACTTALLAIPNTVSFKAKGETLTGPERAALRCPDCGGWARPHVLWFDETYNEHFFRFHSSLLAASEAGLLLVIGTSGSTNLPHQVAARVYQAGGMLVDINPQKNPFSAYAEQSGGFHLPLASSKILPNLIEHLTS